MTQKIYTFGYGGRHPADIKNLLDTLDGVLFDIRFSPRSRDPRWAKKNVAAAVGPERYRHVKVLGNRNYKGGPIEFVNFDEGLALIQQESRPVVLMCACKDPAGCHRTVAANRLRELGFEVIEVGRGEEGVRAKVSQTSFFKEL